MSEKLEQALSSLPKPLRQELIEEFRNLQANFYARHWSPTELSGGKFCEIVYSIIANHTSGNYPSAASKPKNVLAACQALEQDNQLPRSFRILIPRMLPALYEVRNNRGVGHVGGDVDPNHMDSTLVLSMTSWIMGEIVRVLHSVALEEAQAIVSELSAHQAPAVWVSEQTRRVLDPSLKLGEQVLLLIGSLERPATLNEICSWVETSKPAYIKRLLKTMHKNRIIEFTEQAIHILPPGQLLLHQLLAREGGI